jgi:hypothetical protein
VLDLLGVAVPDGPQIQSRSFAPLLRGERATHRESALYAYNNRRIGVTDGEWTLLRFHDAAAAPAAIYTHNVQQGLGFGMNQRRERPMVVPTIEAGQFIPGLEMPVWRVPLPVDYAAERPPPNDDLLFHTAADPEQLHDLAATRPDQLRRLEELLRERAMAANAPDEQLRRLRIS